MITALLVDDHMIARAGLKCILRSIPTIKVVGEASGGLEAVELVKQLNPQIVFMDIQMPGIDGLETTRRILSFNKTVKVIMLSVLTEDPYPSRLLETGAVSYLGKGCSTEELMYAVSNVLSDKRYIPKAMAQQIALKNIKKDYYTIFDTLSLREFQVAQLLMKGMEVKAIAKLFFLNIRTVVAYRHQVLEKLNCTNDVQLLLLAKKLGLTPFYR
ncbi:MAG: uvrY [Gammaproteobacteria bacterium]|jgi:DNA-binding NarL/FixJ family response regulator|nr:uvrY [Gammaproteobacteria bacterium]